MFRDNYDVKVYMKEELVSEVHVKNGKVTFENRDYLPIWLPFGVRKMATIDDLEEFYEERCFPRDRENCKEILHKLDIDYYEPEWICRKTHGLQFDDFIWLQFSDEQQVC